MVLTGFGTFSVRERPARTGHNQNRRGHGNQGQQVSGLQAGKTLGDAIK